jgi:isopentenyl diphosphate isomerase/L-lactate dehydrogenase-like FMN-dependent dehydrogenase
MVNVDRRTFLWASTAIAAGAAIPDLASATESNTIKETADPSSTPTPSVTKTLARYIIAANYENLPEKVRKEGMRTLLNWIGVAVGGSRHETVNIAVNALAPFSGPAQATILGRRERFDV